MNHSQLLIQYQRLEPEEKMLFVQKLLKIKPLALSVDVTDPIVASALCFAIADQIREGRESKNR